MNVYIVQCNQYFKIGKADRPINRFGNLQTSNPYELTLIASLETENAFYIEAKIHEKLRDYKARNGRSEWFILTIHQVEKILKEYGFTRTDCKFQNISDVFNSQDIIAIKKLHKIECETERTEIEDERISLLVEMYAERKYAEQKVEFEKWKQDYKMQLANFIKQALTSNYI